MSQTFAPSRFRHTHARGLSRLQAVSPRIRESDGANRGEGELLPVGESDGPPVPMPVTFLDCAVLSIVTPSTESPASVSVD